MTPALIIIGVVVWLLIGLAVGGNRAFSVKHRMFGIYRRRGMDDDLAYKKSQLAWFITLFLASIAGPLMLAVEAFNDRKGSER